jgi:hypothetical protein
MSELERSVSTTGCRLLIDDRDFDPMVKFLGLEVIET